MFLASFSWRRVLEEDSVEREDETNTGLLYEDSLLDRVYIFIL